MNTVTCLFIEATNIVCTNVCRRQHSSFIDLSVSISFLQVPYLLHQLLLCPRLLLLCPRLLLQGLDHFIVWL